MARSLPKVCPFLVTVDLKLKWPELPRPTLQLPECWRHQSDWRMTFTVCIGHMIGTDSNENDRFFFGKLHKQHTVH